MLDDLVSAKTRHMFGVIILRIKFCMHQQREERSGIGTFIEFCPKLACCLSSALLYISENPSPSSFAEFATLRFIFSPETPS